MVVVDVVVGTVVVVDVVVVGTVVVVDVVVGTVVVVVVDVVVVVVAVVPVWTSTESTLSVVAPAVTVTGLEISWGPSGEAVEPPQVGSKSTL